MFHWELTRGKLRHDPVYLQLLQRGLLPDGDGRLLDLGCGRGILLSLLVTARERLARGLYPEGWPPPPCGLELVGIETSARAATVARSALGAEARIEVADLRDAPLPPARAALLLDVLHYLPAAAQEELLARVAAALPPGGLLLVRDADAGGGWRFTATRIQERACALARRHWRQRFHYRSAAEWRRLLEAAGFEVDVAPMAGGTPYANVLLAGRRI
jgi:SAM-dependent methyltransferase